MKRVALNGFGRIGKNFLRAYLHDSSAHTLYEIHAINIGPADINAVAYMIRYDTLLGAYTAPIAVVGTVLHIGNFKIQLLQETDATKLPWAALDIDIVVDATGHYTHAKDAQQHLNAGARKVLITAPAHGEDITIVMGVNQSQYHVDKHTIISLGSCTTNALVPLLHVMKSHVKIQYVLAHTVHAYTNTQALLDVNPHAKDFRRSRAAALNIIPSSTGASLSVIAVFPEFKATLAASSLRVPVPVVSLAQVTLLLEKPVACNTIHAWFSEAASGTLKRILAVTNEPLVSSDFQGNSHSVIFDETQTVIAGSLVKIQGWYDNEWGYSNRINDFLKMTAVGK